MPGDALGLTREDGLMVDFKTMLANAAKPAPVEPRELHGQLKKRRDTGISAMFKRKS